MSTLRVNMLVRRSDAFLKRLPFAHRRDAENDVGVIEEFDWASREYPNRQPWHVRWASFSQDTTPEWPMDIAPATPEWLDAHGWEV